METLSYDSVGKISLDHVYDEPDPKAYFAALRELGYRVPQEAKPVFQRLLAARRETNGDENAKIVDLGCSYGVNAALLKHDMTIEALYELYGEQAPDDRSALIARDRKVFADPVDGALSVVGVDAARHAIAYAVDTGMMDGGIATNLEVKEPSNSDVAAIRDADMIISTGCVGYVTEQSIGKIVETSLDKGVWMANFVLRMFDYEPVADLMDEHGYVTEKLDGVLFPQRQFASLEEREHVLSNLRGLGVSFDGAEGEGWYFAELHVSRPEEDVRAAPLDRILTGAVGGPPVFDRALTQAQFSA